MRTKRGCGIVLLAAICLALAAGPARAADDAMRPPPTNAALATPPPLSAEHAAETLGPVIIEGRPIRRPSVHDVFEHNLQRDESPRFETVDMGNGHRCTRVLPFGYEQCTNGPALFEFRVG